MGGDYDPSKIYDKLVCVSYDSQSWVSMSEVPAGNIPGTNSGYWQLISGRGAKGDKGDQGEKGDKGDPGLEGRQGPKGNSGYSGLINELLVYNGLDSDDATAALAALQGKVLDEKLAQLSQEWNEIKAAEFNISLNPHVEKIDMGTTSAATIEPDKFYVFGAVSRLAIGLAPQADSKYAAQYLFQFTCPADAPTSLSVPMDLLWNEVPSFKAGRIYQISILENLALATAWQLPSEE